MIHTIQADFYRLFRSKGFWITELVLFALMLMGHAWQRCTCRPRLSYSNCRSDSLSPCICCRWHPPRKWR